MASKKREGMVMKTLRYLLVSGGKGVSESISVFKKREKREFPPGKLPSSKLPQERTKEDPAKGKIKHTPSFKNFEVEKKVSGDYSNFNKRLQEESKIVLIFGRRGSGKSALGLRIMEDIKAKTDRNCYTLGINEKFLPNWISSISNVDEAEQESIILVDEGALTFNARESMKETNKELSKIMAIARHKNLTLLFITQNTGMIDRNILKLADSLMIKEGSLLQLEMERSEIKKFYEKAKELIDKVDDEKIKYFYLIDSDFEGLLKHSLPSFWTNQLSKNKSSS